MNDVQRGSTRMRLTRQRKVLMEELSRTRSHPTAAELYQVVRRRLPRISLGTVYRNLEALAARGQIVKLVLPGSPARFDATCDEHYHVRCVVCGRVDDIPVPPLPQVAETVRLAIPHAVLGIRLEVDGLCPRCHGRSGRSGRERQ